jgi:hypothetical protein
MVARWRGKPEPGPRQRVTILPEYLDHAGRQWRPGELTAWTARGTVAALDAALGVLEDQELKLRAGLDPLLIGLSPPPRAAPTSRPALPRPRDALEPWP